MKEFNKINDREINESENVFEKIHLEKRSYGRIETKKREVWDYSIRRITSVTMEEVICNGYTFTVKYDRCIQKLTIFDMHEGFYEGNPDPDKDSRVAYGAYAIKVSLSQIPEIVRERKYSDEIREIMKAYYKKYHNDIARYL